MSTIWLIGMMGSGKTTVGERLATRRGSVFYDTDDEIVARMGCSIGELWSMQGEGAFRDLEEVQVSRLAGRDAVVATGGGVVLRGSNVDTMRSSGPVVWLQASVDVLAARVGAGEERPLLEGGSVQERLTGVLSDRLDQYRSAATVVVGTDDRSIDEVVEEVERCIGS